MRILLVSHRYPPDGAAGVERYARSLAGGLRAAGDDVRVVARAGPQSRHALRHREALDSDQGIVERLPATAASLDRFLIGHRALEAEFADVLRAFQPEVVHVLHCLGLSPRLLHLAAAVDAMLVVSLLDFYFACPLVHLEDRQGRLCPGPDGGRRCARECFGHEGGPALARWTARAEYFSRLLRLPDAVLAPSRYVAAYFSRLAPIQDALHVQPLGLTVAVGACREGVPVEQRSPRQLRLAFVGAVQPAKGAHWILEAIRGAGLPATELRIIGRVADRAYARRLATTGHAIPGLSVRFVGPYEPPDLADLLAPVDCVVVPSSVPESYSFTAREALAAGVPVLVSRLGALPEAVLEGVNGFTFAPRDPRELGTLLQRLMHEDGLLARLKTGARTTALPTSAEHVRAVRQIYSGVPRSSRRSTLLPELDLAFQNLLAHGLATPLHSREALSVLGHMVRRAWRQGGLGAVAERAWQRLKSARPA